MRTWCGWSASARRSSAATRRPRPRHTSRVTHIDYADLTDAERRFARRVIPFYTFARHNIPIQARGLAGSPGRYATVEKTRDASAESSGLDENFAYGLPSYVQRQVPFALPGGLSAAGLPLAANLKLPLNDLNALDIRTWPDEVAQRMSVLMKMPAEQWAKYDAFFKDEIRKDFVPAPSWVMNPTVKKGIEDSTGSKIKMIYDRKSRRDGAGLVVARRQGVPAPADHGHDRQRDDARQDAAREGRARGGRLYRRPAPVHAGSGRSQDPDAVRRARRRWRASRRRSSRP